MPYSNRSKLELATADPRLVALFNRVENVFDNTIVDGIRTVEQQRKNVQAGLSKTMDSAHLPDASGKARAVDAIPYFPGFDWDHTPSIPDSIKTLFDLQQIFFAGFVLGVASQSADILKGASIRYGGDWDMSHDLRHNHFQDLDHFELHDAE